MEKAVFDQTNLKIEDCIDLISSQFDIQEPENVQEISEEINGVEYVGLEYNVSYDKDSDKENFDIIRDPKKNQITLKVVNELNEDIFFDSFIVGTEEKPNFEQLGLEYALQVEMPGKVLSTNIGKIEGDIVTTDSIHWPDNQLVVVSEINSNLVTMLVMAFTVLLIIIILLIIMFINLQHKRILKKRGAPSKYRIENKDNDISKTLMLEEKEDELY